MHRLRLPGRNTGAAAISIAGIAAAAVGLAHEPDPTTTRGIMRDVFAALRIALPASLDEAGFADPARRPEIQNALETLARHARALQIHAASAEEGFVFLSRSLARDAAEIQRRYEAGRTSEARFLLQGVVETCASCHARLPDRNDATLSMRFMDETAVAALPLPERATLAMATRQFEQALAAQESLLNTPGSDVSAIEMLGILEDYLEICVRVKEDYARPARTLARVAEREDVRPQLRASIAHWVSDLREFDADPPTRDFDAARQLVVEAEERTRKLEERSQLARYVTASGVLHRYVAGLPPGDPRAAEPYYWLGVIESRIGRSFWLSQTEPYLEAAIRLAPSTPLAEEAYAMLEEYVVLGYTGSSGENVPPDVARWLDELQRLINMSREEDDS